MLEWTEAFSTGVEEIDQQHKILFRFINELEEDVRRGSTREVLAKAIRVMENFINEHFGFEEICMFSYKCPQAEQNKNAHRQFIEKLKEFKSQADSGETYLKSLRDIHEFCEQWLTSHILAVDAHLKECKKIT